MRRYILLFFILSLGFQPDSFAQKPAKYWIQFKDKQYTTYSVDHPEQFLSPKAIQKRMQLGISVTEQDFPVNQQYIDKIMALDSNMILFTQSKWLNGITVYSNTEEILDDIQSLNFVMFCEKTIQMKEEEDKIDYHFLYINDQHPLQIQEIPLDIDYGFSKYQLRVNNIHWLHRLGFRGKNILMMLLDGGFHNVDTLRHFALLREENRLRGCRNFVQPSESAFRGGFHGTSVLSCIASYIPGELVGSAPLVSVWLAQTEDSRSENKVEEDNWVAGVEWADSLGCDILNSSLGYTKFDDTTQIRTYANLDGKSSRASQVATIAAAKGMIICNSAGNEGNKTWRYIGCPADAQDILAVGGVDTACKRAPFSSYGPTADGRIKPDAVAVGWNSYVADQHSKTLKGSGTSFASPLMAGMVACLWEAFPKKSNYEIMEAVRQSGNRANAPDSSLGYGITDFLKAYNLLLQQINNSLLKIDIASYVITTKTIEFQIEAATSMNVTVNAKVKSGKSKKVETKLKLQQGINKISLSIPLLHKKLDFDFIDLTIHEENIIHSFILGLERKEK